MTGGAKSHTFFESTDVSTDEIEESSGDDEAMTRLKKKIIAAPRPTSSTSAKGNKKALAEGWKKVTRKK